MRGQDLLQTQKEVLLRNVDGYIKKADAIGVLSILTDKMDESGQTAMKQGIDAITDMPPIQSEIIRCTDCTKFGTEACPMYICDGWMTNDLDDYCSYADKVTERGEHE